MTDDHATHVTELSSPKPLRAEIDAGLRQFLLSVYNYMGSGLVLTGLVAYGAAETGLYASLVQTPVLFWGVVLAPLALVFFLSFRIEKMSLGTAQASFWAYADAAKDDTSQRSASSRLSSLRFKSTSSSTATRCW